MRLNGHILSLTYIMAVFMMCSSAMSAQADPFQILKISAEDERAVIKTPDEKLFVVKVGDIVVRGGAAGTAVPNLRIMQIVPGRIVLEEQTQLGSETVIVNIVKGKQHVERVQQVRNAQAHSYAAKSQDIRKPNGQSVFPAGKKVNKKQKKEIRQ